MFLRPVNQLHEVVDLTVGAWAQHVDLGTVLELRRELLEQVRERVAEPLRVLEAVGVGPRAARILDLLLARRYLGHVAREGAARAPEIDLEGQCVLARLALEHPLQGRVRNPSPTPVLPPPPLAPVTPPPPP